MGREDAATLDRSDVKKRNKCSMRQVVITEGNKGRGWPCLCAQPSALPTIRYWFVTSSVVMQDDSCWWYRLCSGRSMIRIETNVSAGVAMLGIR